MGNVYARSTLNISAIDGGGLFHNREPNQLHGWILPVPKQSLFDKTSYWQCTPGRYGNDFGEESSLYSRAWVFQENFLSPRGLKMGKNEVYWECRCVRNSETLRCATADTFVHIPDSIFRWGDGYQHMLTGFWDQVVSGYSPLQLTFWKDKFIALSGVSSIFAKKFKATFVAGLVRLQSPCIIFGLVFGAKYHSKESSK